MVSPYATQEDPKALWYEQSNFVSTHLAAIGYGFHIAVYFTVLYYLWQNRSPTKVRSSLLWVAFNTLLFALGSINLACSVKYNQQAYVDEREYPGGPFIFLIERGNLGYMTLSNSASILASFLSDGLLLWRAGVLWNFAWYIVLPPAGFFIACIILSVMTVIQLALPNVALPPLSLAVWIVLMILPIWLTFLIAGRILYHRRTMVAALGSEYAANYTGITAIVVESAIPFAVISLILLGLFGNQNTAQNLFIALMVQVECIAPELIVLRVIRGRSWTRDTLSGAPTSERRGSSNGNEPVSEIEFASFASPGVSKRDDEESIIEVLSSGDRTRSTLQSMTEKSGSQTAADSQSSRSKVEKE